jgi:hypothetical protein
MYNGIIVTNTPHDILIEVETSEGCTDIYSILKAFNAEIDLIKKYPCSENKKIILEAIYTLSELQKYLTTQLNDI